jgi:hypothetical protein
MKLILLGKEQAKMSWSLYASEAPRLSNQIGSNRELLVNA